MNEYQPTDNRITFTFKKTYLYIVLALALGFSGGFGVASLFFDSDIPDEATRGSGQVIGQQEGRSPANPAPGIPQQGSVVHIPIEGRPSQGPEDAAVTVVEFTDYQCPFCQRHASDTSPQLLSQNAGKMKYVVLNFPITSIHPYAHKAAEAAECAHDQGQFWEYHDLLFENQSALDVDSLKRYAVDLGMDSGAFNSCLDSGAKAELVQNDIRLGQGAGIRGTPSFIINGQLLVGAKPISEFQARIDAALVK
jgi:protein-disulfide isomerase